MKASMLALSVIAADFSNLSKEFDMINNSGVDLLHVDIMDGCFVPNISLGFPALRSISKLSKLPMDVHLMLKHPEPYLERCKAHGAHSISVHIESCIHVHRTIEKIQALGCRVGMAINPSTPVSALEKIAPLLDIVLIMMVEPGYCGQTLLPHSFQKIEQTRKLLTSSNARASIEVDGGVNAENADRLRRAGADILVSGAAFFKARDRVDFVRKLKAVS